MMLSFISGVMFACFIFLAYCVGFYHGGKVNKAAETTMQKNVPKHTAVYEEEPAICPEDDEVRLNELLKEYRERGGEVEYTAKF